MSELSARAKSAVLTLCCAGQFMVILDVSVVNVALPSIRADLGFTVSGLQWVVNAYTVLFAGFLLLGGRATDLLPERGVFVWGFVLFGGSSLIGGFAPNAVTLVLARGVQGLGAAVLAPATLSILNNTFTGPSERNRALGAWGATGGAGGSVGVLLGGVFTELLDWRWVLFINAPIGAVAVLAALRWMPSGAPAASGRSFDAAGASAASAGLIAVVYAIVRSESDGWAAPGPLVSLAVGIALLAGFLAIERRAANPLLPLGVLRRRRLATANVAIFLLGFAVLSMWYFATLYLQQVLHYSPIEAGLAFAPMSTLLAVGSGTAGKVASRFGPGRVGAVGLGLIASGMLLFATAPVGGSYLLNVLPASLVTASGIGLGLVSVTAAATQDAAREEAGLASGLVNTSRQVGGSLGLAVLATVAGTRADSLAGTTSAAEATNSGFHAAFVTGAVAAAAGALLSATLARAAAPAPAEPARPGKHRLSSAATAWWSSSIETQPTVPMPHPRHRTASHRNPTWVPSTATQPTVPIPMIRPANRPSTHVRTLAAQRFHNDGFR